MTVSSPRNRPNRNFTAAKSLGERAASYSVARLSIAARSRAVLPSASVRLTSASHSEPKCYYIISIYAYLDQIT